MVDVNNLDSLDATTEQEIAREYHNESLRAISSSASFEGFRKQRYAKLTDPLEYYKRVVGAKDIFRMIVTHPDMDHMTGLHRIHEQESSISLLNFWHTGAYNFELDNCSWNDSPYDEQDWLTYKSLRDGTNPRSLHQRRGKTGEYWTEDGVEIWAPTDNLEKLAVDRGEKNILSMILKIFYKGHSMVLGGDATADETWPNVMNSVEVGHVLVLKASHHGRNSGYYQPAVKAMNPWLTITSVAETEHDATQKYRQYSERTVSLRKVGDIQITITDDGRAYYYPKNIETYWKDKLT
jgi:beta-lactamase superfamily II metal-dependent hydrolase